MIPLPSAPCGRTQKQHGTHSMKLLQTYTRKMPHCSPLSVVVRCRTRCLRDVLTNTAVEAAQDDLIRSPLLGVHGCMKVVIVNLPVTPEAGSWQHSQLSECTRNHNRVKAMVRLVSQRLNKGSGRRFRSRV